MLQCYVTPLGRLLNMANLKLRPPLLNPIYSPPSMWWNGLVWQKFRVETVDAEVKGNRILISMNRIGGSCHVRTRIDIPTINT